MAGQEVGRTAASGTVHGSFETQGRQQLTVRVNADTSVGTIVRVKSMRRGSHAVSQDGVEGPLRASTAGRRRCRRLNRLSTRSTVPARARYRSSDNVWATERTTRSLHDGIGDFNGVPMPDKAIEGLDGFLGLLWG